MAIEVIGFGPGFWGPIIATASMLLVAAVGWLIVRGGRQLSVTKPSPEKYTTYACGEELTPEEIHTDSEQFFSPIRRVFGPFYRRIRPGHGGDLHMYLFWTVLGFIIIFAIIVLVMGVG